jgi:hypothetical protein
LIAVKPLKIAYFYKCSNHFSVSFSITRHSYNIIDYASQFKLPFQVVSDFICTTITVKYFWAISLSSKFLMVANQDHCRHCSSQTFRPPHPGLTNMQKLNDLHARWLCDPLIKTLHPKMQWAVLCFNVGCK